MPLVTCPDCGHQVSTRATSCPGCGCPVGQAAESQDAAGTPAAAAPQPSQLDPLVALSIELGQLGAATAEGGKLILLPKATQNLPAIVGKAAWAFEAGSFRTLSIMGPDWRDEHIKQLVELLIGGHLKHEGLFSVSVGADGLARLGSLTELSLTGCASLTDASMYELAQLATLRMVDLTGWVIEASNGYFMNQLCRLPRLEQLKVPSSVRNNKEAAEVFYITVNDFFPSASVQ